MLFGFIRHFGDFSRSDYPPDLHIAVRRTSPPWELFKHEKSVSSRFFEWSLLFPVVFDCNRIVRLAGNCLSWQAAQRCNSLKDLGSAKQ